MLIVDYETFVRMPAGTIFAPFTPCIFEDRFEIKVDPGYEYTDLFSGKKRWGFNGTMTLEPWLGEEFADQLPDGPVYGKYETELGFYDGSSADASEYKMFAVLEPHEVKRLMNALQWALDGCTGEFNEKTGELLRVIAVPKEEKTNG